MLRRLNSPDRIGPLIGGADFARATFTGNSIFKHAKFSRHADFHGASFENAVFDKAFFERSALFNRATFEGSRFRECSFESLADFDRCAFIDSTYFSHAAFKAAVKFSGVNVGGHAFFRESTFSRRLHLGPILCERTLDLSEAHFMAPATLQISARSVTLDRSLFESSAKLMLRHAEISMDDVILNQPTHLASNSVIFGSRRHPLKESAFGGARSRVHVTTLRGVDCSLLTMANIDLAPCRFQEALHLDLIRLEGKCTFGSPPTGQLIPPRFPWLQRQVIEEERIWRSTRRARTAGWGSPPRLLRETPKLAALAIVYRQLRKAREDAKDEPGAADFYYGEMEMRRHSKGWRTAERWLLQAYWLLSGYGLRASRALGWLALAMMITIWSMMLWGLPQDSPKQEATGVVPPGGGKVTFEIDKDDPKNPTGDHFTGERFDKALSVTLNSVVFRSSGQDLTTAGGYIEMASRFSEPVLLGLAALAIRGRVKR